MIAIKCNTFCGFGLKSEKKVRIFFFVPKLHDIKNSFGLKDGAVKKRQASVKTAFTREVSLVLSCVRPSSRRTLTKLTSKKTESCCEPARQKVSVLPPFTQQFIDMRLFFLVILSVRLLHHLTKLVLKFNEL